MCYIMKYEWWVTEEWVEVAGSTEKSYKLQNNSTHSLTTHISLCVYMLYIFGFLMVIKLFIIVCLKCQLVILYHKSLQ